MINETIQELKPLSPLVLRFHHLLCLPLFEGKGYSDKFSANMAGIKQFAENPENSKEEITFICNFDSVCENCPNKSETGCLLNGDDKDGIEDKDRYIAELLNVKDGFSTNYKSALKLAEENIHYDEFIKICGECRWYKAGICSFEKWKSNVEGVTNGRL